MNKPNELCGKPNIQLKYKPKCCEKIKIKRLKKYVKGHTSNRVNIYENEY